MQTMASQTLQSEVLTATPRIDVNSTNSSKIGSGKTPGQVYKGVPPMFERSIQDSLIIHLTDQKMVF